MSKLPSTPPQTRIYAVGDIHGRLDLLTRLLAMIEDDAAKQHKKKKKRLIFLGDYVDRGLDSRGVLERLTQSFSSALQPVFIRGNHDDLMLQFLKGNLALAPSWLQWGGAATIASYGCNPFGGANGNKLEALFNDFSKKVPPEHLAFLDNTVMAVTYGDYYFVHAGVKAGVPLDKQKPDDQMWSREDFLDRKDDYGAVVVHGHTIRTEAEVRKNRIGIDTGAFATGRLTCLVLDGTEQTFLQT